MSYIALTTTTLSSAASSVTFSSIPTSVNGVALRDLVVVLTMPTAAGNSNVTMFFNGDTAGNYSRVGMGGNGSATYSFSNGVNGVGFIFAEQANQNSIVQIMDYSATDKHKTLLARGNSPASETLAVAGRWANTAAITSVLISVSGVTFPVGTRFSLFGIAG